MREITDSIQYTIYTVRKAKIDNQLDDGYRLVQNNRFFEEKKPFVTIVNSQGRHIERALQI